MKLAVAKKSGKEFIVLEETEVTTLLKDKVSGEEREIKNTTLKRNYEVAEIEEEEVKEEVKSEEAPTGVKVGLSDAVVESMFCGKDIESHIKEIAVQAVEGIPFESGNFKEALKYRDNARQAYKENENKFLAACGAYKIAQERVKDLEAKADQSSLPFALEAVEDISKDLSKYQEKMVGFYSRYVQGWNEIKRFREEEKVKISEAAKEDK